MKIIEQIIAQNLNVNVDHDFDENIDDAFVDMIDWNKKKQIYYEKQDIKIAVKVLLQKFFK